ncbi:hypothetical protein ACKI1S_46670 [Streptomyces galilaeus]|uniref:Uncharacterized protein n=1 Tax=Streptomyces galilaeus TaxID=33899 RepID=A0ABW9IZW2_STRGJ
MSSLFGLDTYVGWEQPRHFNDCKRPAWDIGIRRVENEYRSSGRGYGEPAPRHKCADEEYCSHGSSFTKQVVRMVCHSCGSMQIVTGEASDDTGGTTGSTKHIAYGLPPRRVAGLLLWPAQPWLDVGRLSSEEPHDFVVTRPTVKHATQVTADTVVGQITQSMGKRRGRIWTTLAVPNPDGPYGRLVSPVHYAHANDGHDKGGSPLRTVTAAARWIAARLAEASAVERAA